MIINKNDNVEVNIKDGHKYALCDIKQGEKVIKYGNPIGVAIADIKKGEHIHTHNLKTLLDEKKEYHFDKPFIPAKPQKCDRTFLGYRRKNGTVGIRNDIWIINTVGCVNGVGRKLGDLTGAFCYEHPYGCSQLGDDLKITQKVLRGLAENPNAGGVLILGLGCENNNIKEFKKVLSEHEFDGERVRFLNVQDAEDEIEEGVRLINELKEYASSFKREEIPLSELKIGLKCGGSDGLSGITANPLVGRVCDKITDMGGSCVLTEVPEMFGAEHLLMERCVSREVFEKTVKLINDFKAYYTEHNQPVYENPSPGNKEGGITTLEEKSLGCIQKGGGAPVTDVLNIGDAVKAKGLSLLKGPGNDLVAVTNLCASGVNLILFTTGRGTPLGSPVPVIKISTNNELGKKKANWIDFDASGVLSKNSLTDELIDFIIDVASGTPTKNELNGCREIAIFKDGVTL